MAERERMAQEIHDTLAQGFTSIVMLSQAVRADVERGRATRPSSAWTWSSGPRATTSPRRARWWLGLRPGGPAEDRSDAALQRLADRFGEETGLVVVTSGSTPGRPRCAATAR